MGAKIERIRPSVLITKGELLSLLYGVAGQVERGEITAIAVVGVMPNRKAFIDWRTSEDDVLRLLGASTILTNDIGYNSLAPDPDCGERDHVG